MDHHVKIIDLFAGPGGLGEGFSSYEAGNGDQPFRIALSVEKEASAHSTLQLRAFYRQFDKGCAPKEYYDYLAGKLGKHPQDQLYKLRHVRKQAEAAAAEARQFELGKNNAQIEATIEKALGTNPGNWVLIGGPPCQAYSLVGRSRNAGNKSYKPENDHRNFLYEEYLNIISRFRPAVFVMENVKGMISAKVNGEKIFPKILQDLRLPGKAIDSNAVGGEYEIFSLVEPLSDPVDPRSFIIRSEMYGIPQARHRVILLGIRSDIAATVTPSLLALECGFLTSEDVLIDLPRLRSGLSKETDNTEVWRNRIIQESTRTISSLRRYGTANVAETMESAIEKISSESLTRGSSWNVCNTQGIKSDHHISSWYRDPSGWSGVCNHEARGHMGADLARYLYCSAYGLVNDRSPKAADFPETLTPDHKNWESGKFADRFRVQTANRCATTITSHISKDGHYFIHYDPSQCRSFTVREAARIQTFPDNYFFVGGRTDQYTQVGNAVPPYLASKIAQIVFGVIKNSV